MAKSHCLARIGPFPIKTVLLPLTSERIVSGDDTQAHRHQEEYGCTEHSSLNTSQASVKQGLFSTLPTKEEGGYIYKLGNLGGRTGASHQK